VLVRTVTPFAFTTRSPVMFFIPTAQAIVAFTVRPETERYVPAVHHAPVAVFIDTV
jgi:hypothetical protein